MAKKLTITDIAELAGVSVSTVSRSLQDSPKISKRTKDKVQKIAERHNFRINLRARNFRTQKSHVVGVLTNLNHSEKQAVSDQFLFSLINSISANLLVNHYDLLLHTAQELTADLASSYVYNQKVDGIIIIGQGKNQHQEITKLSQKDIPFVVWGGYTDELYTTVGSDNFKGTYKATKHLIEVSQKRKLVFLGAPEHHEIKQRYAGFTKALEDCKMKPAIDEADPTAFCIESGYQATRDLFESRTKFDGLICASDTIALGSINFLSSQGVSIPKDVSVIGYDDISISKDWSPRLTTILQDTDLGGKLLVEKVLAKIDGKSPKSTQMDGPLIVRDSA